MRIIIIILLAILFSTNYYFGQDLIQNGGFDYGKYINTDKECEYFEFKIDGTFIHNLLCDTLKDKIIYEENCGNLKYVIDSMPHKNNFFIRSFNSKTGECIHRYHLNFDFPVLIITPLKQKLNITDHFTEPVIYLHERFFGKYSVPSSPKMIIYIPFNFKKDFFYIAYDQNIQNEKNFIGENDVNIEVPISGLIKINQFPDTRIYAYNNYLAYFKDGEKKVKIPIVSEKELRKLDSLNSDQIKVFFSERGIHQNSKYLVPGRFNPDRVRVVNKVFGETIIGQVQDFQLVEYK